MSDQVYGVMLVLALAGALVGAYIIGRENGYTRGWLACFKSLTKPTEEAHDD